MATRTWCCAERAEASGGRSRYGSPISRVIVAYGSKHGATAEIAAAIGEVLRSSGHRVDVNAAADLTEIEPYDAVVLGSAVYMGRWRRDARALLRRLRRTLGERPLWVFSSGPLGADEPDPSDRWQYPMKIRTAVEQLGAREAVVFGGRAPLEPRGFMERSFVKNTPEEERDARDFEAIRAWASGIASELGDG